MRRHTPSMLVAATAALALATSIAVNLVTDGMHVAAGARVWVLLVTILFTVLTVMIAIYQSRRVSQHQ